MPKRFAPFVILLLALLLVAGEALGTGGARYQRSIEKFTIPDVVLVNQDGERVRLKSLLETDQPVVVDFIYGTCTTICPVLSAGFASLQRKLAKEGRSARLVSISIDPENDTPKVMKEYLERYRAEPGWDFLTGSRPDIDNVMTAFDAYVSDKMSHLPLNFIRSSKDGSWVRLYGFIGSRDFLNEFEKADMQ